MMKKSDNESNKTDERFYTPRAQASTARSTGSYGTPRSHRSSVASSSSDGEQFVTPRNYDPQQYSFPYNNHSSSSAHHSLIARSERRNLIPPHHNNHIRSSNNQKAAAISEVNYLRFNNEDGDDEESRGADRFPTKGFSGHLSTQVNFNCRETSSIGPTKQDIESIFSFCRHGRIEAVATLLQRGIHPDVKDVNHGNSILSIACQNGNKRLVKLALRNGADVNTTNFRGNTPLHFCYKYNHFELGEYLITKGADKSIKNIDGHTYEDLSN